MLLYHGSPNLNVKALKPIAGYNHLKDNKSRVYLTQSKAFAACFGVKWHDGVGHQWTIDRKEFHLSLSPKIPINNPCVIYICEANPRSLERIKYFEFISYEPVKVVDRIDYDTFLECVTENGVIFDHNFKG